MNFHPERLGPGAIYHRSLDELFRSYADLIGVAEIEPQTLWTKPTGAGATPRSSPAELRHLAALPQRRLLHGVGFPIGGTICDQEKHVPEFRRWADTLESSWCSEHLSVLEVEGAHGSHPCGFLMPPLQTDQAVQLAASNIRQRGAVVGLPFAFETGVNYFAPRAGEMADGEFFRAVAEAADCGILLDLTNLWVNHKNGRACIEDVLASLPLDRIWEVHLAGIEYAHGHWLDAHSCAVDRDLARIASELVGSLPNLGTVVFEIAPDRVSPFGSSSFLREMELLNRLWETSAKPVPVSDHAPNQPVVTTAEAAVSPKAWETFIATQMFPSSERPRSTAPAEALRDEDERSFVLYRKLVASFREGTIAELLENTTRLLLLGLGEERLRALLARYMASTLPPVYPTDEALGFREFLERNPVALEGLADVLLFESTLVEGAANNTTHRISLTRNIETLLTDIASGRVPAATPKSEPTVFEIAVDPLPSIRVLEAQAA